MHQAFRGFPHHCHCKNQQTSFKSNNTSVNEMGSLLATVAYTTHLDGNPRCSKPQTDLFYMLDDGWMNLVIMPSFMHCQG